MKWMSMISIATWIDAAAAFSSSVRIFRHTRIKQWNHRSKAGVDPLFGMSEAVKERLLLTEPAQNAFIVAEMRDFLETSLERNDNPGGKFTKWAMTENEKTAANLIDGHGTIIDEEYGRAKSPKMTGGEAVDHLCDATASTFREGFVDQPGLLSALGSAICYFREAYRTGTNLAACERVGVSDYDVAHHITDMYHHRNYRGAYTKTLMPSGKGEVAARIAVGLDLETGKEDGVENNSIRGEEMDDDECLLWSPTTPDVCIHRKSEDEAWRKTRFERIQMEGTKDPRRGGSGTLR